MVRSYSVACNGEVTGFHSPAMILVEGWLSPIHFLFEPYSNPFILIQVGFIYLFIIRLR